MLRLLTFTNLYPNPMQPRHGIFVEHRLRRLVASGKIESQVIAPIPWCPVPLGDRYPEYRLDDVPMEEKRHGIIVHHPRFLAAPMVTSHINPWLMMRSALPLARRLIAQGYDFDVVDAQFIYPDGVAGAMLAAQLGKPATLTARGSDVNVALREALPLRWFKWAMKNVAAFITVSSALKEALCVVGVPEAKITVIRNGVDLELFKEGDREFNRRKLSFRAPTLLSIGNLVESKGHHLVVAALAALKEFELVVIGQGPEHANLQRLAEQVGVGSRVRFVAHVSQPELAAYYSAADVTVLASSREGMANVLLESLACGTPVVTTDVGGSPEVIADPAAGILMRERTAEAVIEGVRALVACGISRAATRTYALRFGWDEPISRQVQLFEEVSARYRTACAA